MPRGGPSKFFKHSDEIPPPPALLLGGQCLCSHLFIYPAILLHLHTSPSQHRDLTLHIVPLHLLHHVHHPRHPGDGYKGGQCHSHHFHHLHVRLHHLVLLVVRQLVPHEHGQAQGQQTVLRRRRRGVLWCAKLVTNRVLSMFDQHNSVARKQCYGEHLMNKTSGMWRQKTCLKCSAWKALELWIKALVPPFPRDRVKSYWS